MKKRVLFFLCALILAVVPLMTGCSPKGLLENSQPDFSTIKNFSAQTVITTTKRDADDTKQFVETVDFKLTRIKKQMRVSLTASRALSQFSMQQDVQETQAKFNNWQYFLYKENYYSQISLSGGEPQRYSEGGKTYSAFRATIQFEFEKVTQIYALERTKELQKSREDGYTVVTLVLDEQEYETFFAFIATNLYGNWEMQSNVNNVFKKVDTVSCKYYFRGSKLQKRVVEFEGFSWSDGLTYGTNVVYDTSFAYKKITPNEPEGF